MTAEDKNEYHVVDYDENNKTLLGVPIWLLFTDKVAHSLSKQELDRKYDSSDFVRLGYADDDDLDPVHPALRQDEKLFDHYSKIGTRGGEPGYSDAMNSAFSYMLNNLNTKLNAEEFKKIHQLCIHQVKGSDIFREEFHPGGYGFNPKKASLLAKNEWEEDKLIITWPRSLVLNSEEIINNSISDGYLSYYFELEGHVQGIRSLYEAKFDENNEEVKKIIVDKINKFFDEYYAKMKMAKDNNEKLSLIVSLCKKLEIGHFFSDGNQRTIVFVILNKLLIENKFYPTILDDPTMFDGYHSKAELVEDVKRRQKYFLECVNCVNENKKEKKFSDTIDSVKENRSVIEKTNATEISTNKNSLFTSQPTDVNSQPTDVNSQPTDVNSQHTAVNNKGNRK